MYTLLVILVAMFCFAIGFVMGIFFFKNNLISEDKKLTDNLNGDINE